MSYLKSYKRLNRLIQDESFEPLISWGIRMGLSGTMPVIWGLATGRMNEAVWAAIASEAVSWVEMKGSFAWRVRTLVSGAALAIFFSFLGTITAPYIWLSVIGMFAVGFLSTLLKNLGDRASGLAICVYMLFIICNAYPAQGLIDLKHRMVMVAAGAIWPVVVGMVISLLTPKEEPFRRQIALIWRSIAVLVGAISRNASDKVSREFIEDVYAKEKDVRTALDNSFQFFGRMAHQVNQKDNQQFQLANLRKSAGVVAATVLAMGEEMEHIDVPELDNSMRIKAATLFNALQEAVSRISVFIISLRPEEKVLALSQINRLKKLTALIKQYPLPPGEKQTNAINRILLLTERTVKLLESAIQRVEQMGKDVPVFRSYPLVKTLFILRPKYLLSYLRVLFNFDTFNTRYALRSAIAATIGIFVFKWFNVDHGYWLPFSVMIIIQPYFRATFQKAIDRVVGTLLGGLAGSLLLYLPTGLHIKEGIFFLTLILMIYYARRQYAIATFVITLNLVLLFNLESAYSNMIMVSRALCTIGGALLAVFSGFALLPTWDKKLLPSHLADAINCNYGYFIATFYSPERITSWTRNKRNAESKNSNVFDSFNRYMEEPGKEKSAIYYDLITYNVRITRNINNVHLEQDEKKITPGAKATPEQQQKINECLDWFNKVIDFLPRLYPDIKAKPLQYDPQFVTPYQINDAQMISLEKLLIELKTMHAEMAQLVK